MTAQVLVLLIIRCSRQQQHLTILLLNKVTDIAITHALTIAKVVALVNDNQFVVSCIIHINRLCNRHDVGFQVILSAILSPHVLQIGRADNQRIAAKGIFIHLSNGTGGDSFSQSHHIANHGTTTLLVVQMAGSNFDGCLLEIEKAALELWRNGKFLDASTSLFAQMVGRFQIYIIRWYLLFSCPTVVNNLYQFFGDVKAELVFPTVIEPTG